MKAAKAPLKDFVEDRLRLAKIIRETIEKDETLKLVEVIPADEILGKIKRGELIEYVNVIVEGILDLSKADLKKDGDGKFVVTSVIKIINSNILDFARFGKASFHKSVWFKNTQFESLAYFGFSQFHKEAVFTDARFCDNAFFTGVHFYEGAYFGGSRFKGTAKFSREVRFDGTAKFGEAKFKGDAIFSGAQFNGYAGFYTTRFRKKSFFDQVEFLKRAEFEKIHFWGITSFSLARFHEDVSFSYSKFLEDKDKSHTSVDFDHAIFHGDADFVDVRFLKYKRVNFMNSVFNGEANFEGETVFLEDADFKGAKFKGDVYFYSTDFKKMLLLRGANFNRLRVPSWSSIKDKIDCDGPAYLLLVSSFKKLEQFDNADDCLYDYREWRRTSNDVSKEKRSNWSKLYDFISHYSCGYGVRLRFPLAWIFGSVFGFGILYSNMYQINPINSIILDSIKISALTIIFVLGKISKFDYLDSYLTSIFDQTYNTLIQTIYYFGDNIYLSTLIFTGQTPVNFQPVGAWKYAVMFESVLGYLFLALFVVVLARKLIR